MICFSISVDVLADRINGSHQGKRQGAFLFASESHHGVLSDWGAVMEGGVNTPDDSTPETERSSYRRERSKALWTQSGCRYFNDADSSWKQINRIRMSVGFRAWHSATRGQVEYIHIYVHFPFLLTSLPFSQPSSSYLHCGTSVLISSFSSRRVFYLIICYLQDEIDNI